MEKTVNHIANIISDYEELLYDDFPYLFIGKNKNGDFVIGSFGYENSSEEVYYHTLTSIKNLLNYFKGIISYHTLLQQQDAKIFECIKNQNGKKSFKEITFQDIPEEFRPMEISFYILNAPKCLKELENNVKKGKSKKENYKNLIKARSIG